MRTRLLTIFKTLLISVCLVQAGNDMLYAQEYENTPVTISKEKVKVGGKVCYSHIVQERQTLYSISKAYEVSIEDIYKFNPTLQETGLKKNSIIIIPSPEALNETIKTAEPETKTVEAKNEEPKAAEPKPGSSKKRIHVRKWYEDLEMIAAQYNVSVEDIMTANKLTDKQLTNRQKLIIPSDGQPYQEPSEVLDQTVGNDIEEIATDTSANEEQSEDIADGEETSEVVVPSSRTTSVTALLPMRNMEGKLSRNNMDFYSGMMLAVYDLSQSGVNIDISTYDITDQENPVTTEEVEGSDIVIGPISAADQTRLLQTSDEIKAIISPLDPRSEKLVAEYNELIQAPTPHRVQYEDLTNWIKEEMQENDKVIMFTEKTARINKAVDTMKEVMDSSGITYTGFSYSILEGRDILEPLKEIMTPEGQNRIYIASESEAFVNDVVRNLNLMLLENYQVILYAPSKIRSFETIEVEHFHKTAMRVSLNYYINYNEQAVKDFLMKYRAIYNTEPSQFAFQGYDIAHYFITLCNKYGENWIEHLDGTEKAMLQSTFKFSKLGTGGYVNTGVRRIVYGPKWTVTLVK